MGADLYWEDKRRREKGYSAGYNDGQESMAKHLSQCRKKMKKIKGIYENDEPFKALKIKEIVYGDLK